MIFRDTVCCCFKIQQINQQNGIKQNEKRNAEHENLKRTDLGISIAFRVKVYLFIKHLDDWEWMSQWMNVNCETKKYHLSDQISGATIG